ncbi:GerW family sporulation protein [Butyrivibrio sp. JL13D10]|uniref:GerW family sporulation protein n=1 Tax=Butyrivibrio sp. JL13D10 TaxID=3236815 RepID=UPI0038B41CF7
MGDSNFNSVVDSLMGGMNKILGAKTVVGEATKVGDTIIVPLVDVSFGVGAGASDADKKNSGAGGFAAKMSPSAVLVIKNGQTKLVNIKNQDAVTKVLDLVPDIADRFMNRGNDIMDDDSAVDIAFPEDENLK